MMVRKELSWGKYMRSWILTDEKEERKGLFIGRRNSRYETSEWALAL